MNLYTFCKETNKLQVACVRPNLDYVAFLLSVPHHVRYRTGDVTDP